MTNEDANQGYVRLGDILDNMRPMLDIAQRKGIDLTIDPRDIVGHQTLKADPPPHFGPTVTKKTIEEAADKLRKADYAKTEAYLTYYMMLLERLETAVGMFLTNVRENHDMSENERFRCEDMNRMDDVLAELEQWRAN